jgi:hypothetical protein
MIKLERTDVMNFENAIRGARNPLNSWAKSDSYYDENNNYILGKNDLSLAQRLAIAGSDHRKYLRQIFVSVDITAPLYWWKEYDTYKVGTVANSCSTMHKIHAREFTIHDFSNENLMRDRDGWNIEDEYAEGESPLAVLEYVVAVLNFYRKKFIETKEKRYWWQMIQLLPSSYNQMRTCTLTYENLIAMYPARKNHKLDEWHTFCDWIETLPYFKEICLGGESIE